MDAAAGAAGDQYSFGSGAERTFELLKYYITHDLHTYELLSDENGDRADALKRVLIAPFFFTDRLSEQQNTEGKTYQGPNLDLAVYTAMLKQ
ncbi:hypothetical protein [Arsenophonus endosymbiont of Aleurodicus floccissimus]|uniref:hypothetical protein n=1 Tax=Arsenophonus endosymbiont of Aleurodicus floccissimus TaxID=2152761 RepID=UPI001EDEC5B4|nr:hypothetical protein [Arsenophonus endosymbiont of Aleurodicus floccissimus]